jgi:hypothetical protein
MSYYVGRQEFQRAWRQRNILKLPLKSPFKKGGDVATRETMKRKRCLYGSARLWKEGGIRESRLRYSLSSCLFSGGGGGF